MSKAGDRLVPVERSEQCAMLLQALCCTFREITQKKTVTGLLGLFVGDKSQKWRTGTLTCAALLQTICSRDKIGASTVLEHRKGFARWLYQRLTAPSRRYISQMRPHEPKAIAEQLWSIMRPYLLKYHPHKVAESQKMLQLANMAKPHTWYPLAASMQRHIIYHAGPTNSGKTYSALQVLLPIIVCSCQTCILAACVCT